MVNIKLLKSWNGHSSGDIVAVSNNVAYGLIESGTARETTNRDYLVKPQFGESKAFEDNPGGFTPKVKKGRKTKRY